MVDFDFKLGEWFKKVEQKEKELKAKKNVKQDVYDAPVPSKEVEMGVVSADIEASAQDMPVSVVATVESEEIVADADAIGHADNQAQCQQVNIPVSNENTAPSLFSDVETPELTDFLTFLEKPRDRKPEISSDISKEPEIQYDRMPLIHQPEEQLEKSELPVKIENKAQNAVDDLVLEISPGIEEKLNEEPVNTEMPCVSEDQGTLALSSEGTGTPRPIIKEKVQEPDNSTEQPVQVSNIPSTSINQNAVIEQENIPDKTPDMLIQAQSGQVKKQETMQEKWDRMPAHLQVLFGTATEEVAQNSYKQFKETRDQLIQRLLDPTLSLEEAARILNVCPTTVRRYTNRGVLKHYRTAGNQRRFKLSDVLSFMESQNRKGTTGNGDKE